MKIQTISRGQDFNRERVGDLYKINRNLNSQLHQFEKQREYTRALNSVKLDKLFSKPFMASLNGHIDAIYTIAKGSINNIVSGSADGEIRVWNVSNQKTIWKSNPYTSFVKGLSFVPFNLSQFVSVGDKTVHLFDINNNNDEQYKKPIASYLSNHIFNSVDHHRSIPCFATASSVIQLWDHTRSEPTGSMNWGSETITSVKFNQTETNVLASCGSDRSLVFYDIRTLKPVSKVFMKFKTNAISWNPMEAFNFSTASEDHNCYSFDMRRLDNAMGVAKGHVSAVMDIDHSPTGQEFVSASYDKTIRIFEAQSGKARDVYHTKRMQKTFCVKFSGDSRYVLSASDDGNIRLWKAHASEKLGVLSNREKSTKQYTDALKKRYNQMPEIARIKNHKRLPKAITKATARKHVMLQAAKTKVDNRRKNSRPGTVPVEAERQKHILKVE